MIPLFRPLAPFLYLCLLAFGKTSQKLPVQSEPLSFSITSVSSSSSLRWTDLLASSSNLISSTCSRLAFFARWMYVAPSVRRAMLDFLCDIVKATGADGVDNAGQLGD